MQVVCISYYEWRTPHLPVLISQWVGRRTVVWDTKGQPQEYVSFLFYLSHLFACETVSCRIEW